MRVASKVQRATSLSAQLARGVLFERLMLLRTGASHALRLMLFRTAYVDGPLFARSFGTEVVEAVVCVCPAF